MPKGSDTLGNLGWREVFFSCSISSGKADQTVTSLFVFFNILASAIPHVPAPKIAIEFNIFLRGNNYSSSFGKSDVQ